MNRILSLAIVLITSAILIAGCSIPTPTPTPTPTITPTPTPGPQVGKLAPDFQLPNLVGQSISLSDLRGKPVFLNFWATWCGPCLHEMPFIQEIFEEWSDKGLVILAIDIGEAPSKVRDFIQSGNFSFPVLLDTNQNVALEYNVRGIPTTFLIDKDGIIQEMRVGSFSSTAEIEKSLSKIIPLVKR